MTRRLFVIGTDTEVGKTAVASALLRHARMKGLRVLPYKPASSGGDDPERLLDAAGLDRAMLPRIAPLRYEEPLAPGIAEDPRPFVGEVTEDDALADRGRDLLSTICGQLSALEAELRPDLTIIEGAGGWHVPMPGATWLPQWVEALDAPLLLVGRLGLGTINHTLLTLDTLARAGRTPLGFILSATRSSADPSTAANPAIIAHASGLPCLGILGHGASTIDLRADAWARLLGQA